MCPTHFLLFFIEFCTQQLPQRVTRKAPVGRLHIANLCVFIVYLAGGTNVFWEQDIYIFFNTGNNSHIKEAEDFFEQVCVEDFNTKADVIFWKQVLNEIRYNTSFYQDDWNTLPFDQSSITMHLISHCKVSINKKYV